MRHIILYECRGDDRELTRLSQVGGSSCYLNQASPLNCNAIVAHWAFGSKVSSVSNLNRLIIKNLTHFCCLFIRHGQGYTFPPETGHPLDSRHVHFYMMETHYNNPNFVYTSEMSNIASDSAGFPQQIVDNSGLRLYYIDASRQFDAGVMTIGKCRLSTSCLCLFPILTIHTHHPFYSAV